MRRNCRQFVKLMPVCIAPPLVQDESKRKRQDAWWYKALQQQYHYLADDRQAFNFMESVNQRVLDAQRWKSNRATNGNGSKPRLRGWRD